MSEETESTQSTGGPDLKSEVAKYKAIAERKASQLDSLREEFEQIKEQLQTRSAEDQRAEEERKKKAGEFDQLERELRERLERLESEREELTQGLTQYQERDKASLESLLEGRDDADALRAELDGLPVHRQLALAQRLVSHADRSTAHGPTGTPRPPRQPSAGSSWEDIPEDEQRRAAEVHGIGTDEQRAQYARIYWSSQPRSRSDGLVRVHQPGGEGGTT